MSIQVSNIVSSPVMPEEITKQAYTHPIKVQYTNYKGETAIRTIIPLKFWFGKTEYHPQEQWLLDVWDLERNALRVYTLKDINKWIL